MPKLFLRHGSDCLVGRSLSATPFYGHSAINTFIHILLLFPHGYSERHWVTEILINQNGKEKNNEIIEKYCPKPGLYLNIPSSQTHKKAI